MYINIAKGYEKPLDTQIVKVTIYDNGTKIEVQAVRNNFAKYKEQLKELRKNRKSKKSKRKHRKSKTTKSNEVFEKLKQTSLILYENFVRR